MPVLHGHPGGRALHPGPGNARRPAGCGSETVTLAELLADHTDGWQPPQLGGRAIAQTHCHQHAIMGYGADQALLRAAGSTWTCWTRAAAGWPAISASRLGTTTCPGPAASGYLLPAVRDAAPDTLVLADGFSCRTQIEQGGTGRTPVHLAEILAGGLRGQPVRPSRPEAPDTADYVRLAAGAMAAAALAAGLSAAARRRRKPGLGGRSPGRPP